MRQDDDDDDAASPRMARASSQSYAPISQGRARSLCCMPTLHTTRPAHAPRPNSRSARVHGVIFSRSAPALWQRMVGRQEEKYERKYQTARRWLGQMREEASARGVDRAGEGRRSASFSPAQPSQAKLSRDSQSSQSVQPSPQTVLNIAWICTTPPAQRQLWSRWSKHRLGSTSPTASGWLNCCWCYCCYCCKD